MAKYGPCKKCWALLSHFIAYNLAEHPVTFCTTRECYVCIIILAFIQFLAGGGGEF